MNDKLSIDGVTLEVGDRTPIFLVNSGQSDLHTIPIDKEEFLYRLGETLYRRILCVSQLNPRHNGIRYIPAPESLTMNFPEDRIRTILDWKTEDVTKP